MRRRAYTLIEILIVVVLMGIASAMVVPSLGSTDALRVQSTVRVIVADITVAQSDALARQQCRAMVFDVTNNKYSVVEVPGTVLDPVANTINVVNLNNERKFHSSRIVSAVFDGGNVLYFDELGGPVTQPGGTTPGNGGTIVVSGSGQVYTITVEPYTGRVSVH